jgi:serine/threonine protein kinase
MEYMESKNIAHRDLKLDNILVDENFNLKLADFGFATYCSNSIDKVSKYQKSKNTKLTSFRGTRTYMPPEILAN